MLRKIKKLEAKGHKIEFQGLPIPYSTELPYEVVIADAYLCYNDKKIEMPLLLQKKENG